MPADGGAGTVPPLADPGPFDVSAGPGNESDAGVYGRAAPTAGMRRAAALALLVLLAGCSFGSPGGTPTETVSPAPLPDDVGLPPGVTDDGVTDPRALGEAHRAALAGRSFTLSSNRTVLGPNGTLRSGLDVRVELAEDRSYHARVATDGPDAPVLLGRPPASGVYWSNGSVHFRKLTRENRTTYDRIDPDAAFVGSWQFWTTTVAYGGVRVREPTVLYAQTFDAIPTEVADRRTANGTIVVRLEGDRATSPAFSQLDPDRVRDVSLVAEVDDRGLVRTFHLSYVAVVDGDAYEVDWRIEYDRLDGTTVEPPEWADRAEE